MLNPCPCFKIYRYVQDMNPYTNEPELEREIVKEVFAEPEKEIEKLEAEYPNDKLWFEPDQVWM